MNLPRYFRLLIAVLVLCPGVANTNALAANPMIAAVASHSLALKSDGTVAGWGANAYGQTTIPAGLANVTAIAAGEFHSLALKSDGTVAAWGNNSYGQTTIPAGLTNVTAVAAGRSYSLALKSDGTVAAWGTNTSGQTTVPPGLSSVIAVAADAYHALALKSDGTVAAWGQNGFGQTTVPAGLASVVAVAAGMYHSLALKSDGTVAAWGYDGYTQSTVPAGLVNVVAIAAGAYHSLALKSDGTVAAWGAFSSNQTTIPAGLANVVALAGGDGHSLALKSDGTVVAWGCVDPATNRGQCAVPTGLNLGASTSSSAAPVAATISDARVFAYAEANFPSLFAGTPAIGQTTYQNKLYNYRYYPTSGNYLAVDTSGVISILGSYTNNALTAVGTVTDYADTITAWEVNSSSTSIAPTIPGLSQGTGTAETTVTITGVDTTSASNTVTSVATGVAGASLVGTWILTSGIDTYTNTFGSDGTFTAVKNSSFGNCTGTPTTYSVSGNTTTRQSYTWNCDRSATLINGSSTTIPQDTWTWSISGNKLTITGHYTDGSTLGQYTDVFTRQDTTAGSTMGAPTITGMSSSTGIAGTSVTITGTGFDVTPANNVVSFIGNRAGSVTGGTACEFKSYCSAIFMLETQATVTGATATSISTSVPSGATTGLISVTTAGGTVKSSNSFSVGLPKVTSMTPSTGSAGTLVTITGTNFDITPANNSVSFNGMHATVTASTATSISTSVPSGITNGAVSVTTAGGMGTSASSFSLPGVVTPPPSTGGTIDVASCLSGLTSFTSSESTIYTVPPRPLLERGWLNAANEAVGFSYDTPSATAAYEVGVGVRCMIGGVLTYATSGSPDIRSDIRCSIPRGNAMGNYNSCASKGIAVSPTANTMSFTNTPVIFAGQTALLNGSWSGVTAPASSGTTGGDTAAATAAALACQAQPYTPAGGAGDPQVDGFAKMAQFDACLHRSGYLQYDDEGRTMCTILAATLQQLSSTWSPSPYCPYPF